MSDQLFDTHIAVTGTKGKSTILRLIQHILLCENKKVWGSFGIDGRFYNGNRVQRRRDGEDYFKPAVKCDYILTEANSFLLKSGNYDDISIDAAIFSSFDQTEHTEIHIDKNDYLFSKGKIFRFLKNNGKAIVCRDIENYTEIVKDIKLENIVTYGKHKESDYRVSNISTATSGTTFALSYDENKYPVKSLLIGDFNAVNIAASIACMSALGSVKIEKSIDMISSFAGIFGRNNVIYDKTSGNVIVIDYAHTADSLRLLLSAWKSIFPKKDLICVFGCGGEKSKIKRHLMGDAASTLADRVILTNDNPRNEDPYLIIKDIESKIPEQNMKKVSIELDRSFAIKKTISSHTNSVIIIAGKGNERYITCKGKLIPHKDWDSAMSWILQNNREHELGQTNYVE